MPLLPSPYDVRKQTEDESSLKGVEQNSRRIGTLLQANDYDSHGHLWHALCLHDSGTVRGLGHRGEMLGVAILTIRLL